jgi:hypothetical protein
MKSCCFSSCLLTHCSLQRVARANPVEDNGLVHLPTESRVTLHVYILLSPMLGRQTAGHALNLATLLC